MAFNEREELILEYLRAHKEASVEDLCRVLFVSEATMRRDLTKLHNAKKLVRTHDIPFAVPTFNLFYSVLNRIEHYSIISLDIFFNHNIIRLRELKRRGI